MKKNLLVCAVVLILISISFIAFANQDLIVKLQIGSINAKINDKEVKLDVPPIIQNGRTLVPLRFIGEAFGAKVDWEATSRTITLTIPDIDNLKNEIEALNNQLTSVKNEYNNKIEELNADVNNLKTQLTEKDNEIERIKTEYDERITNLQATISELEDKVKDLEEKLANQNGEEKNPPVIILSNITENQKITDKIEIKGKIEDESQISFVRVKIGSYLIYEGKEISGSIDPINFVSGEYNLSFEAIDAFANKGILNIKINIKNEEKLEPVKMAINAIDMPITETQVQSYLVAMLVNNSKSMLEILKVDAYDKDGTLFDIQGMNFYDLIKMQLGLEHMWLHSGEKISLPSAIDMTNSGKKAKDFFQSWKVVVTLYDSIMEKEFTLEAVLKAK